MNYLPGPKQHLYLKCNGIKPMPSSSGHLPSPSIFPSHQISQTPRGSALNPVLSQSHFSCLFLCPLSLFVFSQRTHIDRLALRLAQRAVHILYAFASFNHVVVSVASGRLENSL